jgi:hypothetical protein
VNFDGTEPEVCAQCGFDSRTWQRRDASALFDSLGSWWHHATTGIDRVDLNRRPSPRVWSALEYGLHSAVVVKILRDIIEQILAADGCDVPDPCPDVDTEDNTRPLTLEPATIINSLEREGAALGRMVAQRDNGWNHLGRLDDGRWWQAEATLLHAVHDTAHHCMDVAEGLVAIGARRAVGDTPPWLEVSRPKPVG